MGESKLKVLQRLLLLPLLSLKLELFGIFGSKVLWKEETSIS